MLKLGKLYIHFLTIAMFIVFTLNDHMPELCASYFSMLLHELAHFAAAAAIGLKASHIALYPFGVNLKLKNKLTARVSEDIILYLSGPAVNIMLALISRYFINTFSDIGYMMYRINICLFVMNVMPILPLDGGCVCKRVLSGWIGVYRAGIVLKWIGVIIASVLFFAGIYIIKKTGYNYSVIIIAVFLIGNVFTQREKYNTEYIRELMYYGNKPVRKMRIYGAYCDEDYRDIVKKFLPAYYSLICIMDNDGRVKEFRTEKEIISHILENNFMKKN